MQNLRNYLDLDLMNIWSLQKVSNTRLQNPRCPSTQKNLTRPVWITERQTCPWTLSYIQTFLSSIPVWSYVLWVLLHTHSLLSSLFTLSHSSWFWFFLPIGSHSLIWRNQDTVCLFTHSHMIQICFISYQSHHCRFLKTIGSCQLPQVTGFVVYFYYRAQAW